MGAITLTTNFVYLFFLFWMIASDLSNTFQDNSTRRCKFQQLVIGAKDERERVLGGIESLTTKDKRHES